MFEKDTLKSKIKKLKLQGVKFNKHRQEIELLRCPNDYKGKFEIPDGVTSIGNNAFCVCKELTNIEIPHSVKSIGNSAFAGCFNLTSVTIPDSVKSIGDRAFVACDNLTDVKIPNSVTSIGGGAFKNCNNLTSVTIPDSVTRILEGAFANCENLTSVTIADSVTLIGRRAFDSHVLLNIKIAGNSRKEIYAGLYNSLLECGKLDKLADVDSDFVKNIVMKNNFLRLIKANRWAIYPKNGEEDYFTLMYNLGLFAKKGTMIEMSDHSKEPIQNVGYAILQRLFNGVIPSEYLDVKNIHKYFGEMEPTNDINEGFIKFLYNKANLDNVIQKEKTQPGYITSLLDRFEWKNFAPNKWWAIVKVLALPALFLYKNIYTSKQKYINNICFFYQKVKFFVDFLKF